LLDQSLKRQDVLKSNIETTIVSSIN